MTFNKGYMCKRCGPVAEAKKRTIAKAIVICCKDCDGVVTAWERPLNERPGRCGNCATSSFSLSVSGGYIMRECKVCGQYDNSETGEVITKGNEERRWKGK